MKPINYLLVEDSVDHAELMADTLESVNPLNTVIRVRDGEEALAYLRRQEPFAEPTNPTPHLILLDLKMPRLNGIETLAIIKKDARLSYIPVVIVSTSRTEQEVSRCYEIGASSFITKPVRFEDFAQKIEIMNLYWSQTSEIPYSIPGKSQAYECTTHRR